MTRTRTRTFLPLVVALSLLAACGEDEEQPASERAAKAAETTPEPAADPTADPTPSDTGSKSAGKADTVVKVSLGEWFIKPQSDEAHSGAIEFEVANDGAVEHELEVVGTDTAPDAFPVAKQKADVEAVGDELGEVEDIEPGGEKEFTVSLEPGKYVLICNIVGHYEPGMYTGFTVE